MASHFFDLVLYRVPWLLWLIATILWYSWFGRVTLARMLGRLSENWFPVLLILAVYLMAAGRIGPELGIPMLFRSDPDIARYSPAVLGAFGATVLIGETWLVIYFLEYINHFGRLDPSQRRNGWGPPKLWATPSKRLRKFRDGRSALEFLAATTPPFLGVLLLIAALPSGLEHGQKFNIRRAAIDVLGYGLGIVLGGLAVAAVILGGWWLSLRAGRVRVLRRGVVRSFALLRTKDLTQTAGWGMATAVTAAFWAFVAVVLLTGLTLITVRLRVIIPSLEVSVLFGLIIALYFILVSLRQSLQLPFLIALASFTVWSNGGAYKYRIPGMGNVQGKSHYEDRNLVPAKLSAEEVAGPEKPLLDNLDVLNTWKARLGEDRPKLVLLSVTGGAYRAGFWTAIVLDELDRRSRPDRDLRGLTNHIRLVTGASGGMVGASYFVVLNGQRPTSLVERMIADTGLDSLTPVVKQMVERDIPMALWPTTYQAVDRGVALERQWKTLGISFAKLYEDEKEGRSPSLIVSPMVIETGERMLISNLDLRHLVEVHSAIGEPYSPSAREFFRLFPAAQSTFGLQTAVRLSAAFPYVSPAVSLPTRPARRLVDAGYYDNYGVNLAAAWAYQYRDWIRCNTDGLALIQIYAYPRADSSTDESDPEENGATVAKRAFQWLTSPIEGALGARDWSMLYRNDEQLRLLDDTFNTPGNQKLFFDTFTFEYRGGAAMNWIITRHDVDEMRRNLPTGPSATPINGSKNTDEMGRLVAWWNDRPTVVRQRRAISVPDRPLGITFANAPQFTKEEQDLIGLHIYNFKTFMFNLGFTPKENVIIKTDESYKTTMHYVYKDNTIYLSPDLPGDYDAFMREYTHFVNCYGQPGLWDNLEGVESGLGDYFPCSYNGSPEFDKYIAPRLKLPSGNLRNLENSDRFDKLATDPERHAEGLVWGAAFWDLRKVLGNDAQGNHLADVLLLRTATRLKPPGAGIEARADFVRQLLEQERQVSSGRFAAQIRNVFGKRGLRL
jgi:predicted acylesterase/phospholipase RssA